MYYFHPYLGKISILTNIFQLGWNHQLDLLFRFYCCYPQLFGAPSTERNQVFVELEKRQKVLALLDAATWMNIDATLFSGSI